MADGPNRRTVLRTLAAGSALGLAGCTESVAADDPLGGDGGDGSDPDPPVVGDPPAGDREITVDVTVLDADGDPVADEPVLLQDRGGTPDDRWGLTDEQGAVTFLENVGPPPCNTQTVVLPERDRSEELGCHDGGRMVTRRYVVEA